VLRPGSACVEETAMVWIVRAVGALVVLFGLWGLIQPAGMVGAVRRAWATPRGKWLAAGFRLLFGLALLGTAAGSDFPTAFRALGALSLLSAAVVLALGYPRELAFVEWWTRRSAAELRVAAAAALAFGVFVVAAVR
jgi:hypothetical protein